MDTRKFINYFSFLKNLKSFCGKREAFDCAGIRARVFRLSVDYIRKKIGT